MSATLDSLPLGSQQDPLLHHWCPKKQEPLGEVCLLEAPLLLSRSWVWAVLSVTMCVVLCFSVSDVRIIEWHIGSDSCCSLKISWPNNLFSPTFLYGTEERKFLCVVLTVCYEWDIIGGVFCVCTYYAWESICICGIHEVLDSVYLKFVLSLHSARNHQ